MNPGPMKEANLISGRRNLGVTKRIVMALLRSLGWSAAEAVRPSQFERLEGSWAVSRFLAASETTRFNPKSFPLPLSPISPTRCSREFALPLRSSLVVVSALKAGGFWFQSGWPKLSSVLEVWFMVNVDRTFGYLYVECLVYTKNIVLEVIDIWVVPVPLIICEIYCFKKKKIPQTKNWSFNTSSHGSVQEKVRGNLIGKRRNLDPRFVSE